MNENDLFVFIKNLDWDNFILNVNNDHDINIQDNQHWQPQSHPYKMTLLLHFWELYSIRAWDHHN